MEQKLTQQALYGTVYKGLLATGEPGRPTRQAPRLPAALVEALEQNVLKQDVPFYPNKHFTVEGNSLAARLTRSKTTDKRITFRSVVVSSQCFVSERSWLSTGWALLKTKANFCRDYLLPAPSVGYSGWVRRELGHDAASAEQTRILQTLRVSGRLVFQHRVAREYLRRMGGVRPSVPTLHEMAICCCVFLELLRTKVHNVAVDGAGSRSVQKLPF